MKIPTDLRWKPTGRTLGQGGQATVVEVTDEGNEYTGSFALKGLSAGKPRKFYERFSREIEAIKAVSHPSIIRIIDHSDPTASFQYYVMELSEGARSLKKLLGTRGNPFRQNALRALSMFIELATGIEACQGVNVVHRDLSPANVLVLPDQSIKIIDFGICQLADAETITLLDEGVGTPNYMAPECEAGAEGDIKASADLYSAGKILWSAITNLHAFGREAPVFGPKSMKSIFPEQPETWHLHHIFKSTVRQDPRNRWHSASEAAKEAAHVRFLVSSGYPPLELLQDKCPICGVGSLANFQGDHMVFGNPNPRGIASLQCDYCGYCLARNIGMIRENMQNRSQLQ